MQFFVFALGSFALQRITSMLKKLLPPFLILAFGAGAWWYLAKPVEKPQPRIMPEQLIKTEVLELQPVDHQVIIDSQGTVRAHYVTTITPQVAGVLRMIHSCFEDGAFFEKDQILAELDPADFQAALASAEARLARAEAALSQENARAKQARLNWEDIGYEEDPSELVLRVPQLKEAEATVKSAKADLDQAQRNLERTKIRAPFAGRVKGRTVGQGQAVGPSTALGEVFASDYAEIRLPISPQQLGFVNLPSLENDPPVPVTLTDAIGVENPASWKAQIVRTEGTLDEATKELFVIARIDDPFGRISKTAPLRIGQPVRARIEGKILQKVFVLPRSSLRGVNRVYFVTQNPSMIEKREILPIWSTTTELIVRDGISAGEKLSISRLPYAPDGAKVEIIAPAIESASDKASTVVLPNS